METNVFLLIDVRRIPTLEILNALPLTVNIFTNE